MGPPDLLEVNMGNDSDHNPSQNDESALDTEDTDTKPDKSEIDELDEKPIKQEPTPGPSQGLLARCSYYLGQLLNKSVFYQIFKNLFCVCRF